jgi:predicted metal-dependent phosphoesterase TrpH
LTTERTWGLAPDDLVDLHVHSTASDGSWPPDRLAERAWRIGVKALALCDHDTADGLDAFMQSAARVGLRGLPAIEVSTELEGRRIHMLAMGVEKPRLEGLNGLLRQIREERVHRNAGMVERMRERELDVSLAEVEAVAAGEIVARPHFARLLVQKGYAADYADAFRRYLGNQASCFVPKRKPPPERVITAIHETGALAILAHPNSLLETGTPELEPVLDRLAEMGLDGLEAYHPDVSFRLRDRLLAYADRHRLLVSGGSDYHGENKEYGRMAIGGGGKKIRARLVAPLLAHLATRPFVSWTGCIAQSGEGTHGT